MHVDLPDDARVRDLTVTPNSLTGYDALVDVGPTAQEVRDDEVTS